MKHVKKSVLLWYTPHEIYELVTDVERYAEFLPWCESTDVLERREDGATARINLAISGVRQSFTTRNTHVPDRRVHMELVDGPFSRLDGVWSFKPLFKPGGAAMGEDGEGPQACKIEFELSYEFANAALDAVISPVFDKVASTFVDSFVQRAEAVYGPR